MTRCIERNTVILGGRRPARAVADFQRRGGVAAGRRGLVVLDRDHHAIDGHLHDFAGAANGIIQAAGAGSADKDAVAPMVSVLAKTHRFLDRHLIDEEDLVVPVLLKFAPAGLA